MPISIPQKDCLQMAVSHELYEDLDSLTGKPRIVSYIDEWAKSNDPSLEKRKQNDHLQILYY